ncbi:hypothetical protein S1OALGB6SA_993, partial [Olavius algarvensis spirochete endosymbiont]
MLARDKILRARREGEGHLSDTGRSTGRALSPRQVNRILP